MSANIQKYVKKKIPQALRNSVWVTYVGRVYIGKCFCCGTEEISHANFACGHIKSEVNGGLTSLENLRPVCVSCNSSMGTTDMDEFKKTFGLNNKKKKMIHISVKKCQNKSFNKFLSSVYLKHLKIFCHWLGLPYSKKKKIEIIHNIMKTTTMRKLKKYVDVSKKYLVTCHNKINSAPHTCKYKLSLKTIKCEICGCHEYFTDTIAKECIRCGSKNITCVHNLFYKFTNPHTSNNKNIKTKLHLTSNKNIKIYLLSLTKIQLIFLCAICLGCCVSMSKNKIDIVKEIIKHKIKFRFMKQRIDTIHKYLTEKVVDIPCKVCKFVKTSGQLMCKKCCRTLLYTDKIKKCCVTHINPFYKKMNN